MKFQIITKGGLYSVRGKNDGWFQRWMSMGYYQHLDGSAKFSWYNYAAGTLFGTIDDCQKAISEYKKFKKKQEEEERLKNEPWRPVSQQEIELHNLKK